jgi:hypothetical protein
LYFLPASFNAGGVEWQAPQALPSFDAIAGVAMDCPVVITIIAPASNNADAVAAALAKTPCLVFGFRIVDLLIVSSIHPACPG